MQIGFGRATSPRRLRSVAREDASVFRFPIPKTTTARLDPPRTTSIAKMKKLGISRPVRSRETKGLSNNALIEQSWQIATD
jgi:hypothetical protein